MACIRHFHFEDKIVGHGGEFLRWRGTLSYGTGSHARARSGEDFL